MQYKYELHCHTEGVSKCAEVAPEAVVCELVKAGYNGVVITDHLNRSTVCDMQDAEWDEVISHFLSGYKRALLSAPEGFTVLLGMELTLDHSYNDYLIYGVTEKFLRAQPRNLMELDLRELSQIISDNGMLLVQAHPFRDYMTVSDPNLLDGIEVYNGNSRARSRNDIATIWAKKFGLMETSGSDYHLPEDVNRGGISTDTVVNNNNDLLQLLKVGDYSIIKTD